jgi:transcriptional regulator with XRE-family HTH domain
MTGTVEQVRMLNLRPLRIRRGWTQEELGRRAGVGVATIRRLERGTARMPRPGTVTKLAAALGVAPLALWDEMPAATVQTAKREGP